MDEDATGTAAELFGLKPGFHMKTSTGIYVIVATETATIIHEEPFPPGPLPNRLLVIWIAGSLGESVCNVGETVRFLEP